MNIEDLLSSYQTVYLQKLPLTEEGIKERFKEIETFKLSTFESLSLFLLRGEYVQDLKQWLYDFVKFRNSTRQDTLPYKGALGFKLEQLSRELTVSRKGFFNTLIGVQRLLTIVEGKIRNSQPSELNVVWLNKIESEWDLFSFFSEVVIPICIQDHILTLLTENDEINKLIVLYERLKKTIEEKYIPPEVAELLKLKYEFVIYKYLALKGRSLNYSFNFERNSIDVNDFGVGLLADYASFFRVVYLEDDLDKNKKREVEKLDTVAKLSVLVKYYSTRRIDRKKLTKLIDGYVNAHTEQESDFDDYARKTVRNFLYNCRFSYDVKSIIKEQKLSLGKVLHALKPELEKIEALQRETEIWNYFPYKKFLEYFIPHIEQRLDSIEAFEAMKFANECLEKFERCLRWCNEHSFLPIQLPFQECLLPIAVANEEHVLFIASGFVRPHDQQKLKQDLEEFRIKLLSLRERYNTLKVITKAQEAAIALKGKMISLGGGGIAVLIFLLTTVNTLNASRKEIALGEMFSLIGGIGVLLLLFLSAVYFIALPPKKSFYRDLRFWFFATLSLFSIVLFLYFLYRF